MRQYSLQLPQELVKGKRYPLLSGTMRFPRRLRLCFRYVCAVRGFVGENRGLQSLAAARIPGGCKALRRKGGCVSQGAFGKKLPELFTKYPIDAERIAHGGILSAGLRQCTAYSERPQRVPFFRSAVLFGIRALRTTARGRKSGMRIAAFICKRQTRGRRGIRHRSLRPRMPQSGSRTSYAKIGRKASASMDDYGHHDGKEARFLRKLGVCDSAEPYGSNVEQWQTALACLRERCGTGRSEACTLRAIGAAGGQDGRQPDPPKPAGRL